MERRTIAVVDMSSGSARKRTTVVAAPAWIGAVFQQQISTQLMDLPNEVLGHITKYLDRASLIRLAWTHPRLRGICLQSDSRERIKSTKVNGFLQAFVSLNPSGVRILDLSNCWSSSERIKALVSECYRLTELSLVNCSLKLQHLLDVLVLLEELRDLNISITESSEKIRFERYPTIRNLYVEFHPSVRAMRSLLKFLEACLGAKNVHLNLVARASDLPPMNPSSLSTEILNSYQTIIFSVYKEEYWSSESVIFQLFSGNAFIQDYFLKSTLTERISWIEREHALTGERIEQQRATGTPSDRYQKLVVDDERELPDSFRAGQHGLRIEFPYRETTSVMPRMDKLSSLVELDLTRCHLLYPLESWQALVTSSPSVEALAVPSCSLSSLDPDSKRFVTSESIIQALRIPKLKKLHVGSRRPCTKCFNHKLGGIFAEYLSEFRHLEELTLAKVLPHRRFFRCLKAPCTMRTAKLNLRSFPTLGGLDGFLKHCANLRNLKLESEFPVASCYFWKALGATNVKQLCLVSQASGRMNVRMLRPYFSRVLMSLDVLHLHMTNLINAGEVHSALEREARYLNFSRGDDPVHLLVLHGWRNSGKPCHPGRSLCSYENFIGTVKPSGWEAS